MVLNLTRLIGASDRRAEAFSARPGAAHKDHKTVAEAEKAANAHDGWSA